MLGSDIAKKVLVKLEEFSPYMPNNKAAGPLLTGNDSLKEVKPIYSYVDETLPQAANEILMVLPLHKLESERPGNTHLHVIDRRTAGTVCSVGLPADYLRLAALRLGSWKYPVHAVTYANTPLAKAQDNEWTMGKFTKPVVVQKEQWLYCYSIKPGTTPSIEEFRYIPVFSLIGEYDDNIAELIALNCAKKIYEVFQNTEGVNMMASEIKSAMEVLAL